MLVKKDEAVKAHQQRICQISTQDLKIYTEESGHNGHIGAAIFSPTASITKGEYIGKDDTHNVYAAAIHMTATLLGEKIDDYTNVYVFRYR